MKYRIENIVIPQDKREEINSKILYLIENNLTDKYKISANDVFNSYSGNGGIHNLNFKDFNSYHAFSEAKKEVEQGQFYTPHILAKFIMDFLKPSITDLIADPTGGIGNFCNYAPIENNFYINEIDIKSVKVARFLYPDATITADSITNYNPNVKFDLIVGNPPFNLKFQVGKDEYISQYYFCMKAQELLKAGGLFCFITPKSFLSNELEQYQKNYLDKYFNFIFQIELNKDIFKSVGVDSFETKIMLFQKKSKYIEDKKFNNNYIEIKGINEAEAERVYNTYVKNLYDEKEKIKAKLYFENIRDNNNQEEKEFQFKVNKLLFDIKRNPKLIKHYAKANEYYNRLYTQTKPENMDYKEWDKIKITKNKVLSYLKKIIKNQHKIEKDEIKLVKWNYGLKLKAYSHKTKLQLSKMNTTKDITFNDMILYNSYPFSDMNYYKTFQKKLNNYNSQSISFQDMKEDKNIKQWLDSLEIYNSESEEVIKLNDVQKNIVNKMLQKKYGYIQSSMGTGKTLMAIAYALYRKQYNSTINTVVVAPSIAINGTWQPCLEAYNIPYRVLKKFSDIKDIKQGEFILVTFNMMCKLNKRLKKYLKVINNKYCLIVDEADSISNIDSKRTKATLSVCKKAKYKLLTSGTMTKNNINESFTQFELLYNSSVNFISENEYIYEEDKETKELIEKYNNNYMKPFPAYKKGLKAFRNSFNPLKVTVFGVGQNTQNIYNSKHLKKLIDKTIITKTFEEVVNKKIYDIIQHTVKFNNNERSLYYKAINEFYSMKYLFSSTGNARKDRMLEIIQQLNLLLNICNHPQTYKEYNSHEIPSKYKKVIELINKWNTEQIAIGCRTLKEIECYSSLIQKCFPNRNLYIITGSNSMSNRKEIIKQLKEDATGILLATQQSLSSSINIGYINKIICTSLSWNMSTLAQFYFRFIRYNSTENKEVHFITYENSLESNLLGLILSKESLNLFMKNQKVDNEELYESFGVTFDLINMLLTKEKDSENHVRIRWGEQEIM